MKRPLHRSFSSLTVLIGAAALSALAAASAQAQLAQQKAPDDAVVVRNGQTVSIDPLTGRLRQPTSQEALNLAQQMLGQYHSTAPLTVQQNSSGMMWVYLPEEYQDVAVLRVLPDGSTTIECVHGPDAAAELALRADLPKADAGAATPAASIAKPVARATHTAAAPVRPKSIRKSVKLASVATARR